MGPLLTITAVVTLFHAGAELRDGLGRYLADVVDWPPLRHPLVGAVLYLVATGAVLVPSLLAVQVSLWWAPWVGAALLADRVSTHLVPTYLYRRAPATTWLDSLAAFGVGVAWLLAPASPSVWAVLGGAASFVGLWPTLIVTRAIWRYRHCSELG